MTGGNWDRHGQLLNHVYLAHKAKRIVINHADYHLLSMTFPAMHPDETAAVYFLSDDGL
jgi:hypothetical protein